MVRRGQRKGESGCLGCVGAVFLLVVLGSMFRHGRPAFLMTQEELRVMVRQEVRIYLQELTPPPTGSPLTSR